jgi:hypothetical protein
MSHTSQALENIAAAALQKPWATRIRFLPPRAPDNRRFSHLFEALVIWVVGVGVFGSTALLVWNWGQHSHPALMGSPVGLFVFLFVPLFLTLGAFAVLGWLRHRRECQGLPDASEMMDFNTFLAGNPRFVPVVARWAEKAPLTLGDMERVQGLARALERAIAADAEDERLQTEKDKATRLLFEEGPLGAALLQQELEKALPVSDAPIAPHRI